MAAPLTLADLRNRLASGLPGLILKCLLDYQTFAKQPPPPDSKGFAAHQAAGKAALAHIDMGVKLLTWAEETEPPADNHSEEVEELIKMAKAVVSEAENKDPGEPCP